MSVVDLRAVQDLKHDVKFDDDLVVANHTDSDRSMLCIINLNYVFQQKLNWLCYVTVKCHPLFHALSCLKTGVGAT